MLELYWLLRMVVQAVVPASKKALLEQSVLEEQEVHSLESFLGLVL